MIPRFDRERFNVSLVSLRRKDLSEETLDALGVDITYLERSKFDPLTLPALLDVVDRKQIDVLHLHGYGATTFGRLAAARRRIPAILHEHANLTDTPWFQKVADRLLEPYTDIALAVSKSTADFVIGARQMPASKVKVVYLGVPLEEFTPDPDRRRDRRRAVGARHPARRFRDRHGHPAPRVERQLLPDRRGRPGRPRTAGGAVLPGRRGTAAAGSAGAGGAARPRRSVRVRRLPARRRAHAVGVRSERVSVAVGRHADHRLRSAGDGKADRRHRRGRPARHPHRCSRCGDRPAARRRSAGGEDRLGDRSSRRTRAPAAPRRGSTGRQYDIGAFVRKMERLYTLLHTVSRATRRRGVLRADLSFLATGVSG